MVSADVKPDWAWLGRPLSVDLANTVMPSPSGPVELLTTPEALQAWLDAQAGRLEQVEPGGAASRLADFVRLRDAVRDVLSWAAGPGSERPVAAVEAVNAAVAAAPSVLELDAGPRGPESSLRLLSSRPSTRVLAALARDAISLAATGESGRLGQCSAPGCGAFYVAARPQQHWCSAACGNRARVARHARRARTSDGN
jgi:predicted RNA-binding Zn ribbon-like protein